MPNRQPPTRLPKTHWHLQHALIVSFSVPQSTEAAHRMLKKTKCVKLHWFPTLISPFILKLSSN